MANLLANITVDDRDLVRYVNAVTREEKRTLKNAYRAMVRPIINDTKKNVRASHYRIKGSIGGGLDLSKGVRGGAWRNNKGASVYIRSPHDDYYKLLFFESGTWHKNDQRYVSHRKGKRLKSKAGRGNVDAGWFFRRSITKHSSRMGDRFDEVLANAIKKAEGK